METAREHPAQTPIPASPTKPARRVGLVGLAPLLAACLWGGMYVVSRASFDAIPPITLGLLRVIIGGLTLWLALRLTVPRAPQTAGVVRRASAPADQWRFLLLGATLAATIITQFWGTALASAHDGALLTTITPVFVVPIAWALLGERPGWRVVAGTGLALIGVVIVVASNVGARGSASSSASLLGDALLLISALCWALFTVLGAPIVRRRSALVASAYATLWSILLLAPFVPFELAQRPFGLITPSLVLAVLYLGWGATALAWFLWYKGVERLDAAVAAVFFFAQPLVGGLLSALFLHETLSPAFWLGGAVLAGGIVLASAQKQTSGSP
ncbi:MAG TPA: EamA family transporter [Ktedonobacterales bacterium]|jgi:drug/metabolite transporter (DMT)-like permease